MTIKDTLIKEHLNTVIDDFKKTLDRMKINSPVDNFEELDKYLSGIEEIIKDSSDEICAHASRQLSIAHLSISAVGLLSLAVNIDDEHIVSPNWVGEHGSPNPNLILRSLLIQTTNNALGCIHLAQIGLLAPARILCRSLLEICLLILVVFSNQEIMKRYTLQFEKKKDEINNWNLYLKNSVITKHITALNKKYCLDADVVKELESIIKENYSYLSAFTHNNYVASIVASMGRRSPEDSFIPAVFGFPSYAIYGFLDTVNFILWYFLLVLYKILSDIHNLKVPQNSEEWAIALLLKESVLKLGLDLGFSEKK